METLDYLGGETWFRLGDRDLALHVERTRRLGAGETLSAVTAGIAERLGISVRIAPMSDDPVRTIVETPEGPLAFQHYFVRDQCRPEVTGFRFDGAETASPGTALKDAVTGSALEMVIICPSNPFISIDPILAVPTVRKMLADCPAPVVAVSPIVGGQAIKGPTAKMLAELGRPTSALAIAEHYRGLIDGFVIDTADAAAAEAIGKLGCKVRVTNTVMKSLQDRVSLARDAVAFAKELQ